MQLLILTVFYASYEKPGFKNMPLGLGLVLVYLNAVRLNLSFFFLGPF
jgi:hypothetical protein